MLDAGRQARVGILLEIMAYYSMGIVHIPIKRVDAPGEVHVLHIHEESFVEQPRPAENLAAKEHETP